jgi:fermentation-respiration switch protein FrsA (DUF1100 family)
VARLPRPRVLLSAAAGVIAVCYMGAIGYLRLQEHAFIFQPADRRVARSPAEFALNETRVEYSSTQGVSLTGWIVPANPAVPARGWLLICHGNYGNIGYGQRPAFYASMRDLGLNLLAFDYRGFGDSSGSPDERGLYDDATASYEYLVRTRQVSPKRLVVFGHSLGSGVAVELASRLPAAGLIVEGAYTSIVDRGQELYPLLPVRYIATQRFPSIDRIATIEMPKLFLHSPDDTVIPYAQGKRLFEAARHPKRMVDVRGGHEDAFRLDRTVYFDAIETFLREAFHQ